MRVSLISDVHNKYKQITKDLLGGDLIICAGDLSARGYREEIKSFCEWYQELNYTYKLFIAGNHDFGFQDFSQLAEDMVWHYNIDYLEDSLICLGDDVYPYEKMIKIYGSPWQPEFHNWAFNLPRNGDKLKEKWDNIPMNTDILITHGPAWGTLDQILGKTEHLGCELLAERIKVVKPQIHVCGHIHTGYGYVFKDGTHYFNASVLNEQYNYFQKPFTFDWDPDTNEINFL